jgi:hypothetical protein
MQQKHNEILAIFLNGKPMDTEKRKEINSLFWTLEDFDIIVNDLNDKLQDKIEDLTLLSERCQLSAKMRTYGLELLNFGNVFNVYHKEFDRCLAHGLKFEEAKIFMQGYEALSKVIRNETTPD